MFSPFRLALAGSLTLFSSGVCVAAPSPVPAPEAVASPAKSETSAVDVVSKKGKLRLRVVLREADAVKALRQIAEKGDLQLVIKSGVIGSVKEMKLEKVSPESALQKVCKAVELGCEVRDGLWIVSPAKIAPAAMDKPKVIDAMAFSDVDASDLFSLLATQFNLSIIVSPEVKGKIPYIQLHNKTPRQAIEAVALAINAKITQEKDGKILVLPQDDVKLTTPVTPEK